MDLNALELFVAIAETSSFSAAARRLGVPKSTVSRGLVRLEKDLGVTLVNRTTRQVSLSTAGQALLERAAPQLVALKKAVGELPEAEEKPSGHLRITAAVDFGATWLPELVTAFLARCPNVSLEVDVSNRLVDLVGEHFDLAFRAAGERLKDSALVARKVGPAGMRLFASPEYLARRGTPRTARDLDEHAWVVFRKGGKVALQGGGDAVTVEVNGRLVADDFFFIREAAIAGAGLALLPSFLAEREVTAGRLVRVLPKLEAKTGAMWVVTPGGQLPKRTVAFRDFAIEWMQAHPLFTQAP